MHISDGVLSAPIWIGGYIATVGIAASGMRKARAEDMPKVAVMTSAFFVASLIHIPLGPTSVHLVLNGLVGIILGPLSFVSILLGLTLQAILFQHGGITTIGANTLMMGLPSLVCYKIFDFNKRFQFRYKELIFGTIAGALGPFMGTIILALLLVSTDNAFIGVAKYAALAHLPVIIIEGILTGFIVLFLIRVKPEILTAIRGSEGGSKMRKISISAIIIPFVVFLWIIPANAHFGCIIPSDDIVSEEDSKTITLNVKFFHPMEGEYMNMEKPAQFGVMISDKKNDLLNTLKEKKIEGHNTWETTYKITRPGDYIFYVEPKPYWEPAEDCHIIHYTKVCVDAFGLEEGWDCEVGLETEIVPLTRPYGLWTGNVFTGIVKVKGRPVPYAEIEVEYYNEDGKITPPADPYVTQVIKADENGVFSYAMPRAGWWGFAALNEASWTMKDPNGKEKPIEIGAVYWVRTRDMK